MEANHWAESGREWVADTLDQSTADRDSLELSKMQELMALCERSETVPAVAELVYRLISGPSAGNAHERSRAFWQRVGPGSGNPAPEDVVTFVDAALAELQERRKPATLREA